MSSSHYKVFAVPVFKPEGEPRSAPFSPKTPITQLLSHAVTAHLVSEVDEPIPFIVGEYDAEGLPEMLTFDGHWMRRAFKTDTHYSIVVAVFTKTEVRSLTGLHRINDKITSHAHRKDQRPSTPSVHSLTLQCISVKYTFED